MAFIVRIEAVQRISEYNGSNAQGDPYCIATWKVKNVVDGTVMLVSCFTNDDNTLKANPGFAMDAQLSIVCRDWSKDGRSGTMNNVNLSNIMGPEKIADVPGQVSSPPIAAAVGNPFGTDGPDGTGLPF